MFVWKKIQQEIAANLNLVIGAEMVEASELIIPPNPELGDLGIALFSLAKKIGKTPNEIGDLVLNGIKFNALIIGAKIVGPYLNFFLSKSHLAGRVVAEIAAEAGKYGQNGFGKKEKIVLEFSNGNTHKELHIGHLRNICYGDSMVKIISACGYDAVPISYINDFGIHVAKTLWGLEAYCKNNLAGKNIEDFPEAERGYLLGKVYVEASTKEKDDPAATAIIGGWKQKIESREGEEYALWKKTRLWSIANFASVYQDLGVKFEDTLYESDLVEDGKKIVGKLLTKGILKKSEGAVVADLEEFGLNVLVFVRSNGTATYSVADLALAHEKEKRFAPDKSIVITDIRQALYFKQLFKILELSGFKEKFLHLGHDFVKLPSGMMSSRTGNVITYQELKKDILARCEAEAKKRHEDWSEEKIKTNAVKIGLGAAKFEMLKVGAKSIITFDIEKALSLEGYTSAYIQYAYARIQSILRKIINYKLSISNIKFKKLSGEKELSLIKKLALFPEIVEKAAINYDPSEIAKYTYELAQMLNDYYHTVPVISAEEETRNVRLSLLSAIAQTIKNGLDLLGIDVVEEM